MVFPGYEDLLQSSPLYRTHMINNVGEFQISRDILYLIDRLYTAKCQS
jgi:hypothetical protein